MGKGSTADCRRQAAPRPRRSPDDRAAHDYAELGLRHLPCRRRGKESLIEDWPNRATADPATIAKWRRRWPGCNWALATGPGSGVFVLDVDGPEGETALAELERRHGPLPDLYPMQWTGSGVGWQGFFAYPDGRDVRNRRLGPKLETRGDGGYVILPPSIHPSGRRYAWAEDRGIHDVDPPPAPGWLLDLIDPPPSRVAWVAPRPPADPGPYALRALESELALVAVAPTARRNDQLNRSAHSLFRLCPDGRLPAAVVACGLLAAAAAAGLAEREAARTIKSAATARGVAL